MKLVLWFGAFALLSCGSPNPKYQSHRDADGELALRAPSPGQLYQCIIYGMQGPTPVFSPAEGEPVCVQNGRVGDPMVVRVCLAQDGAVDAEMVINEPMREPVTVSQAIPGPAQGMFTLSHEQGSVAFTCRKRDAVQ